MPSAAPIRILIADDNKLIRSAIAALLSRQANFQVCGEAADAAQAMEKARELQPDLILLDISMPGANGLETARALRQELPQAKILIVSQHDSKHMLPSSLEAGAQGCIDKARLAIDLLPTIRQILTA